MKKSFLWGLCLITFALLMSGCGGGSQLNLMHAGLISNNNLSTGRLAMTITWPVRSRLIPEVASSIQVTLTSSGSLIASQRFARPVSGNTTNVSFNNVPVGTVIMTATAYPNSDGTGVAQAQGSTPVQVQSNQTATVTLTMASTIDHLELSPLNPTITVGKIQQMTVTAKDVNGNVVLLSANKLLWVSSNTAAATVTTGGQVVGKGVGNTQLTVTDTESQKSVATNIKVDPAPVPISWWKAENNALDSVDGNNGNVSGGVTYGLAHSGQGFVFNGVDGVINLGDPPNLRITGSITIDVWVNVAALPSGQLWGKIVFRGDDRDGIDPYFLGVYQDGSLAWQVAAAFGVTAQLTTPISLGTFHHIVATLDDATGDMRLYMDGQLKAQTTTTVRPARDLDPSYIGGVAIGNSAGAPASFFHYSFNGTIDEVKIYNQVVLP